MPPTHSNKLSLLIVDDDPAINAMLALVLENQGYQTESAYSVEQAERFIQQKTFALVLLDLGLPPMNTHQSKA